MSKGVPWDVAFSMDLTRRLAACIVLGQNDGGIWDWGQMKWEPPRNG